MKPLALDLCCGLGGWTHGLLAEGWDVIGVDIEEHVYGSDRYPAQLILQDIRTLTGHQFRGRVSLVVGSPPCTEFSYMSMPWRRGKQIEAALLGRGEFPKDYRGSRTVAQLTELFDACFRIGREVGCPTVIENVRGAQKWVGRAQWNYGSFYLFGDVPALMPITQPRRKSSPRIDTHLIGSWHESRFLTKSERSEGFKTSGLNWSDRSLKGQDFTRIAGQQAEAVKVASESGRRTDPGNGVRFTSRDCGIENGVKFSQSGDAWFDGTPRDEMLGDKGPAAHGSKSNARKAASAQIAKIPLVLARHIARVYYPKPVSA